MAIPKIPETETMNVSEARRQFSDVLNRVRRREARVVVEKSGIPVGAMVSMADFERIKRADEDRERLLEVMASIAEGFEGIPEDELEAEVGKAIEEVEAERRARREAQQQKAS